MTVERWRCSRLMLAVICCSLYPAARGVTVHNGPTVDHSSNGSDYSKSNGHVLLKDWHVSATPAPQDVQDAQANNGVLLELQAHLSQWDSIWMIVNGLIVSGINEACNSADYYSQCCPNAGPQGSSFALYASVETVSVAYGYPQKSPSNPDNNIQAIVYAQPITNNTLCQQTPSGRRRRNVNPLVMDSLKKLSRVKRSALSSYNFIPQSVLYAAVQQVSANITSELASCCSSGIASVAASKAAQLPVVFPTWAILVIVLGVLLVCFIVAAALYIVLSKKPKKMVDSTTQTFSDITVTATVDEKGIVKSES